MHEPRCLERHDRICGSMGFVKCVFCKIHHGIINAVCYCFIDPVRNASLYVTLFIAVHKVLSFFVNDILLFLAHGTAYIIRLSHCVSGKFLYDLHYLFLIDDTPICRFQYGFQLTAGVRDAFRLILSLDVLRDKFHRTWAVQRNPCDHIFKALGTELFHKALHSCALKLEDPICIPGRDMVKCFWIVIIDLVNIDLYPFCSLNMLCRIIDNCKSTQPKEIHF